MSVLRYLAAVGKGYAKHLKPLSHIARSKSPQWDWQTVGEDPGFSVKTRIPLYSGWYMLELELDSSLDRAESKLYFDYGRGITEADSVAVYSKSGSVRKRLIYLKETVHFLRFDPLHRAGNFTVHSLKFVPVSAEFAQRRMMTRIQRKSSVWGCKTLSQVQLAIRQKALKNGLSYRDTLFSEYNDTFKTDAFLCSGASYDQWIEKYETPLFADPIKLQKTIEGFKNQATVSLILPVYNVAESYLREAIDSVREQVYQNWQLCIVDDASTQAHIRPVLEEYAALDKRIDVLFSAENEHISAASNRALAIAKGELVAFLDHDDLLAKHALFCMVQAYNENPNGQVFYSDEDKVDEYGERLKPHFKPDWNKDLFYSVNYLCHLTMLPKALVDELGGFRKGVEGSQDYDLLLRAAAKIEFKDIVHVPHILYHWRMIAGSTAHTSADKSYTSEAGKVALQDHFKALGMSDVKVDDIGIANLYRINYPLPASQPLVSLLIPTRDKLEFLQPCVDSILEKTDYKNYEIVILDNGSTETKTLDYLATIAEHDRVRVIRYDEEFNYSAINNFAVRQVEGDIIGLINNDVAVITPDWLTEMVSHALRDEVGCVGAKLLYADDSVQHAGVVLGVGGVAGHAFGGIKQTDPGYFTRAVVVQNYSAVTAACLVVKKSIFEEIGGLDEESLKIAFNDVDFCLKVRDAGYRNVWTPHACLYHYESRSRGYEDTPEKQRRFRAEVAVMKLRWGQKLYEDPAYSGNLSLRDGNYHIRD